MDDGYATYLRRTWAKELLRKGFLWFLKWFFRHIMTLEVRGLENVPEQGPYIIGAKHASHSDSGAAYYALGSKCVKLKVAAARDHFFEGRRAILGKFWDAAIGAVPLERRKEHLTQVREDFSFLQRLLAKGYTLLFYPQGGRQPDDNGQKLSAFKEGIGHLALTCGVPIIPCAIKGTEQFLTKTRGMLHFIRVLLSPRLLGQRTIIVSFGEPIFPRGAHGEEKSTAEITKEVWNAVRDLLEAI